jgi:hypothetical protein
VLSKLVHNNNESRKSATATARAVCLIALAFSLGIKTRHNAPRNGKNVIKVRNI